MGPISMAVDLGASIWNCKHTEPRPVGSVFLYPEFDVLARWKTYSAFMASLVMAR